MDAFDSDIVIFASKEDQRGELLIHAIQSQPDGIVGIGSMVLLTETLVPDPTDIRLVAILARLELIVVNEQIAAFAAELRRTYRLKTPHALHLASAIAAGADRFVTGNHRDFTDRIREIDIVHPATE